MTVASRLRILAGIVLAGAIAAPAMLVASSSAEEKPQLELWLDDSAALRSNVAELEGSLRCRTDGGSPAERAEYAADTCPVSVSGSGFWAVAVVGDATSDPVYLGREGQLFYTVTSAEPLNYSQHRADVTVRVGAVGAELSGRMNASGRVLGEDRALVVSGREEVAYVIFTAVDAAGSAVKVKSEQFTVDSVAPVVSFASQDGAVRARVDDGRSASELTYRIDGGAWQSVSADSADSAGEAAKDELRHTISMSSGSTLEAIGIDGHGNRSAVARYTAPAPADSSTEAPLPAQAVSVTSAPASVVVGSPASVKVKVKNPVPGQKLSLQFRVGSTWVTTATAKMTAGGAATLNLSSHRATTGGSYTYRVATTNARGVTVASASKKLKRTVVAPKVTGTVASRAEVGKTVKVPARVPGAGRGTTVRLQVYKGSKWVNHKSATTNASGKVSFTLTHNTSTVGTFRWRVAVVDAAGATGASSSKSLQRTAVPKVRSHATSAKVGRKVYVKANLKTAKAGEKVALQFKVKGAWKTYSTAKTDRSGNVKIALGFNAKKKGTYSWRLVNGDQSTSTFTIRRTR